MIEIKALRKGTRMKYASGLDPYINYRFRVKWLVEGEWKTVLGVSKVSGLKRTTDVIAHRSSGEDDRDHKAPGLTSYEAIILERGITLDTTFDKWVSSISPADIENGPLVPFRRDLILEILDEHSNPVVCYKLYGCWASEYTISEFNAESSASAIELIKLELDSWERLAD